MDAIIFAGGVLDSKNPWGQSAVGQPKAFLKIGDKPLVQWVIDALEATPQVGHIIVVGVPEHRRVEGNKVVALLPDYGSAMTNLVAGLRYLRRRNPIDTYALLVASDIPAITPESVAWVIAQKEEDSFDVAYSVVSREVMEKRFPLSQRTYTRLRDVEVCGGDVHMVRLSLEESLLTSFERIVDARKNPLKQARILGWRFLYQMLFRPPTLEEAASLVSERLGVRGRVLLSPYAEIGMDIDKPHQLDLLRRELNS